MLREDKTFAQLASEHYLDLAPQGRDEGDGGASWIRRHDEYDG